MAQGPARVPKKRPTPPKVTKADRGTEGYMGSDVSTTDTPLLTTEGRALERPEPSYARVTTPEESAVLARAQFNRVVQLQVSLRDATGLGPTLDETLQLLVRYAQAGRIPWKGADLADLRFESAARVVKADG